MILRMGETGDAPMHTVAWRHLRGAADAGVMVARVTNHPDTGPHDHVFHELALVESGTAVHRAADGLRTLRPGDLIVLRPLVWHAYDDTRSLGLVNCLIDSTLMQRVAPLLMRFDSAFDLLQKRSPQPSDSPPLILHASPAERAVLRAGLNQMLAEQTERRSGWQAAATAGLLDVLIAVLRLHDGAEAPAPAADEMPSLSGRAEQAVIETASYLESHFTQPASLASLARRVGLSGGHLSRSFSRQMGMGIVAYLHRLRAEEACRLLRCTDAPISRIAARVGYDELAYFSRCFRSQIGQSPRAYRRAPARNHAPMGGLSGERD